MIRIYSIVGSSDEGNASNIINILQKHPWIIKAVIYESPHKLAIEMKQNIHIQQLQELIDPEGIHIIREDESEENE